MTVYYPLKSFSGYLVRYMCVPCDVIDIWETFTSFRDRIKFFSKCFLFERRCVHYCIKQMAKENNGWWF